MRPTSPKLASTGDYHHRGTAGAIIRYSPANRNYQQRLHAQRVNDKNLTRSLRLSQFQQESSMKPLERKILSLGTLGLAGD